MTAPELSDGFVLETRSPACKSLTILVLSRDPVFDHLPLQTRRRNRKRAVWPKAILLNRLLKLLALVFVAYATRVTPRHAIKGVSLSVTLDFSGDVTLERACS
jgi:hypothetical protein